MRIPVSIHARGAAFTRTAICLMRSRGRIAGATSEAKHLYKDMPGVSLAVQAAGYGATELKTAVAAGNTTDTNWASALVQYQIAANEFLALLRPQTVLGRLNGIRRVPFRIRFPKQTGGAVCQWIGEGLPLGVQSLTFESDTIGSAKCGTIIVLADELVRFSSPVAEGLVQNELLASVAAFLDRQFLDPAIIAVVNTSPASITSGTVPVASSGTTAIQLAADFAQMVATLADANIPLIAPYWIMRPADAARLAAKMSTTGSPAFPDIRANGGTLLGIPVLTTNNIPSSVSGGSIIVLLDASQIQLADEGDITLDASAEAAIQMDSAPSAGAQTLVSLWQDNLAALRVVKTINWRRAQDAAVIYLDQVHL